MVTLESVRAGVADALKGAGLHALDYVAEKISPPAVLVVPGDPYLTREGAPFGHALVNLNVLVIGPKGTAQAQADALDDLVVRAWRVLDEEYDVAEISAPGQVNLNGSSFLGAAITITSTEKVE